MRLVVALGVVAGCVAPVVPGDTGAAVVETGGVGSDGCDDAWAGNLTIGSTDDMAAFCGAYRSVTGSLEVSGLADSVDLTGLSCLCDVGAELRVLHSPGLGSLAGLDGLTHVGRSLILGDNLALTDLTGLGGLVDTGGLLLTNTAITSVAGLTQLTAINGALGVYEEPNLVSFDGFPMLDAAPWNLAVKRSDRFASLEGLDWIDSLETLELEELPQLTSLRGLDGLTEVTLAPDGAARALQLTALGIVDVDGLAGLRRVGNGLYLRNNPDLVDLSALHGVASIDGALVIEGNASLTTAEAWALVDAIGEENIAGGVFVGGNGG